MKTELGSTVTDKLTGFTGVVSGRVEYISGCNQLLVVARVGADGAIREPQWFDEQRCEVQNKPRVILDNSETPGCDRPAPKR